MPWNAGPIGFVPKGDVNRVAEFIPYSRQNIAPEDIEAVVRVLKSPLITQGPEVERFEEAIAGYCGVKYAVAFNSGTSALHAALHAAGITAGDEVITTPLTFLATVNAAVYLGAHPVMMDIDPRTYCLDVNQIEALINEKTGRFCRWTMPATRWI